MTARTIRAVDLFCGSGGTSTGLVRACERLGRRVELTAVNHWPIAIETHAANHPWARHECARIDQLDPRAVAPAGRVDLLVASPECTHFSRARGGAPKNDQSRASGWDVLRWIERLTPRAVILENVAEWQDWGPVHATTGQAIDARRGETFHAFIAALTSLGYRVEWRILNAADYGEATTRERLFVQARRGRAAPTWPAATHTRDAGGLFSLGKPWRGAREIIDWSFPSRSIFGRKHPLKPKTLRRIEKGIEALWGAMAEPFLVLLRGTSEQHVSSSARSVREPVPTITAGGGHVGLVQPFLVTPGGADLRSPRPVSEPLPTVTTRDRFGLVQDHGLDIRFRMLQPHELAAAMGFPAGYRFAGNRADQVRQIGNAVCVGVADALCTAALAGAA